MKRIGRALVGLALAVLGSGVPVGCSGGVVGGECRTGLSVCEGHCLDFNRDRDNCGACGKACGAEESCIRGVCGIDTDASVGPDAGEGGRPAGDGSAGHGGTSSDGGAGGNGGIGGATNPPGDGGVDRDAGDASFGGEGGANRGGNAGRGGGGGVAGGGGFGGTYPDGGEICPQPYDTPQNCGNCGVVCRSPTGICAPGNDGHLCVSMCQAPLTQCGQICVNTDTDENNCGTCGHVCASGICQAARCVGATAGHEVVMCMDFRTTAAAGTPQQRLLGNAVFLPFVNPVRILAYSQYTPGGTLNAVKATIQGAATARARTFTLTNEPSTLNITNTLNVFDYDVLVVYDQPTAPAGRLATVGSDLAGAISSFVRAGGTVVVLAGDGGRAEMPAFVSSAGLLDVTAQTSLTGQNAYNRAPGDALGINVLSPFRTVRETCTFTVGTLDPLATAVITDTPPTAGTLGAPVAVHRVVLP